MNPGRADLTSAINILTAQGWFYALTYENFKTAFRIISNLAITSTEKRLADRLVLEVETRGDAEGWIPISQPELAKLCRRCSASCAALPAPGW